ncbi:ParA family protein [Streptomyces clavuligerus]|uniref:ParA family protein n=1 Tax=Streptomyces clavuligerus TaxID=1901 RepID=UPI000185209A|nr:ParA family protein [Streptomyces clavuligerus]WDN55914.1 ParA family protein [Streptomyces clavuligerus]
MTTALASAIDVANESSLPAPVVLAIATQKGGVGKTTTTVNLGARLAMAGYNVLIVDLEPQAQAGTALGVTLGSHADEAANEAELQRSLGFILQMTLQKFPRPHLQQALFDRTHDVLGDFEGHGRLCVLASEEASMSAAQNAFVTKPYKEIVTLRHLLLQEARGFHFVLIDTPPAVSHLNAVALAAADYVVTICLPEYQSIKGALVLSAATHAIATNTGGVCEPQLLGALLNRSNPESAWTTQDVDIRNAMIGDGITAGPGRGLFPFVTDVRRDVRISESYIHGRPAVTRFPNHSCGKQYTGVVEEILDRIQLPRQKWTIAEPVLVEENVDV